jgi:hypothetical protein
VVVASIGTYLQYAEAIGQIQPVSRPMVAIEGPSPAMKALAAENVALQAEWTKAGQAAEPARARSR